MSDIQRELTSISRRIRERRDEVYDYARAKGALHFLRYRRNDFRRPPKLNQLQVESWNFDTGDFRVEAGSFFSNPRDIWFLMDDWQDILDTIIEDGAARELEDAKNVKRFKIIFPKVKEYVRIVFDATIDYKLRHTISATMFSAIGIYNFNQSEFDMIKRSIIEHPEKAIFLDINTTFRTVRVELEYHKTQHPKTYVGYAKFLDAFKDSGHSFGKTCGI